MQLCYRGNTYYRSSKGFGLTDSVTTARFMGNSYTIYRSQANLLAEHILYQYRGVAYTKKPINSNN